MKKIAILLLLISSLKADILYDDTYCPEKFVSCENVFKNVMPNEKVYVNEVYECVKEKREYICPTGFYLKSSLCAKTSDKETLKKGFKMDTKRQFKSYGQGKWIPKQNSSVIQVENPNPSLYLLTTPLGEVDITGKVKSVGEDNDSWGFYIGVGNNEYILFDWRNGEQTYQGVTVRPGINYAKINGNFSNMFGREYLTFAPNSIPNSKIVDIQKIKEVSWQRQVWYDVTIKLRDDNVTIYIDGKELKMSIKKTNEFYFAFYNTSQPKVMFADFKVSPEFRYYCEDKKLKLSKDKMYCTKKALMEKTKETKKSICNYCKTDKEKKKFKMDLEGKTISERILEANKRQINDQKQTRRIEQFIENSVKLGTDIRDVVRVIGQPEKSYILSYDENIRVCKYGSFELGYIIKEEYKPFHQNTIKHINKNKELYRYYDPYTLEHVQK